MATYSCGKLSGCAASAFDKRLALEQFRANIFERAAHAGIRLLLGQRGDRLDQRQPRVEQGNELLAEAHQRYAASLAATPAARRAE